MKKNRCEWQRTPEKGCGVIVGCEQTQEWLLPWWWERYSAENDLPVTFVDVGMTHAARTWCASKGELILLGIDSSFVKSKEHIPVDVAQYWEGFYGPTLWASRPHWFKKPFICLSSPYQHSLWLDLDCEILSSIGDLFSERAQLALVREQATEHFPRLHPETRYNGGVIAFAHGAEIIRDWAQAALVRSGEFWSDDALLSALIYEKEWPVAELSEIYNWKLSKGLNLNTVIHHWVGSAGKAYIKKHGGIKEHYQDLLQP